MDGCTPTTPAIALAELIVYLREKKYKFVTPTPATHGRVNSRSGNERAQSLRDIFGWSRHFPSHLLPEPLFNALATAGIIVERPAGWRCLVRASSLDENIFLHSAFPTTSADAVFFGPDTYRFARAIKANLSEPRLVRRALDLGCGSGAGGVVLAKNSICRKLVLSDINESALQLARVNAKAAGVDATIAYSDLFDQLDGEFDLIVANPPYLNDPLERTYRHGGGALGSEPITSSKAGGLIGNRQRRF
jgi:SAM-dependent methyltransferase